LICFESGFLLWLIAKSGSRTRIVVELFEGPPSYIRSLWPSVVDPYSFFTDPDPELDVGGQSGSGSNTDPGL
jgi:hypothetical protein